MAFPIRRPLEEEALTLALRSLAEVSAIAWSLRNSLTEPLTPEDIALGAEELSANQIIEDLEKIENKITSFALHHLNASPGEWNHAVLSIS